MAIIALMRHPLCRTPPWCMPEGLHQTRNLCASEHATDFRMNATAPPSLDGPVLAVIVISHGPRSTLVEAVRSVLDQKGTLIELLVVHTGPGDVKGLLQTHGMSVPVLSDPVSRYAGAARNLGIANTTAPYVAFLADDCIAAPNWAKARVHAHQQGALAVASALLPTELQHPISLAKFLANHSGRMPRTPVDVALRYGVSYDRRLLENLGPFREDMPGAEDTHYNRRVSKITEVLWNPLVITLHKEPTGFLYALRDQYRRGMTSSAMRRDVGTLPSAKFAARLRNRITHALRTSPSRIEKESSSIYMLTVPFLIAFIIAYELGMRKEQIDCGR